jgi:hypothetical protein
MGHFALCPVIAPSIPRAWRALMGAAALVLAPLAAGATDSGAAARIEADVRFLADDLLEGREAGTRGHEIAARFVAERFRALGFEPGGDGLASYFQEVPLKSGVRDAAAARFTIRRGDETVEFAFEKDFLSGMNFTAGAAEVSAPMVFVGQGVHAPELGHDDLADVDVKGKIAVMFTNAPKRFSTDQRAFYSDSEDKLRELERRGAVGLISIMDPETSRRTPWTKAAENWRRPGMRGVEPDGSLRSDFPGLKGRVSCAVDCVGRIFAGAKHPPEEVLAMFERGELKSFDLPGTATLATRTTITPVSTRNVIGRLPGSDPKLAAEHIVFTAHLDHIGYGVPKKGDSIYNGAMDNALGVAIMLEAGRMLAAESPRPKRSMLLIATTAEEKGLLGAEHFARHPTVPVESLVAEINMDMPVALGDLTDVIAIGIEHSSLQAVAERAVAEAGLSASPDPFPEEVFFVRSDQYPFVRAGVPAIYLDGGIKPADGSDGAARLEAFLKEHYHLPSDDLSLPINWAYAAKMARMNYRVGVIVAADPARPTWNKGDFFGERFGRRAAR